MPESMRFHRVLPHSSPPDRPVFFSTVLVLREIERRGGAWEEIEGTQLFKVRLGDDERMFWGQIPSGTPYVARFVCSQKHMTTEFLQRAGVSASPYFLLLPEDNEEDVLSAFDGLPQPVVVKPTQGTHGKGVYLDISTRDAFLDAVHKIRTEKSDVPIIVESMFSGTEYRILATRDRVIGVTQRVPANVIGDGSLTIRQLIDEKNSDPKRGDGHSLSLVKIVVDDQVISNLNEHDMTLDSIPGEGEQVFLRKVSNLSQGGDSIDVTDDVHPSVFDLAVQCVRAIPGLQFVGVDFMTKDITAQQTDDSYIVIEMNASPMLSMHDIPYKGKNRGAARAFVDILFSDPSTRSTTRH